MIYPIEHYQSKLSVKDTQFAIKKVKDGFQKALANNLNLMRVSAPLFVNKKSGLNDGLDGSQTPVSFQVPFLDDQIEIVHSLAKWKRMALKKYGMDMHQGLYTDMNAIRKDEPTLDNIHSIYVDQWDYEVIIAKEERNLETLFSVVRKVYEALKKVEKEIGELFPCLEKKLAPEIHFISTLELEEMYPNLTRKEREKAICLKYGSVFLYGIGWPLKDGKPHDSRATDYDDWDLNGDILVYDKILDIGLELSSMGIRVDEDSLIKQMRYMNEEEKGKDSPYVQDILHQRLPYTIGGGIGQSRICMFFLDKAHIGEVQCSIWDQKDIQDASEKGIFLL